MALKAKKIFGQHFLKNNDICKKITNNIDIKECDNILEIGPGEGALTKYLIRKTNNLS